MRSRSAVTVDKGTGEPPKAPTVRWSSSGQENWGTRKSNGHSEGVTMR